VRARRKTRSTSALGHACCGEAVEPLVSALPPSRSMRTQKKAATATMAAMTRYARRQRLAPPESDAEGSAFEYFQMRLVMAIQTRLSTSFEILAASSGTRSTISPGLAQVEAKPLGLRSPRRAAVSPRFSPVIHEPQRLVGCPTLGALRRSNKTTASIIHSLSSSWSDRREILPLQGKVANGRMGFSPKDSPRPDKARQAARFAPPGFATRPSGKGFLPNRSLYITTTEALLWCIASIARQILNY
jgi:hypothetical protein